MSPRIIPFLSAAGLALALAAAAPLPAGATSAQAAAPTGDGVVRVKSAYAMAETVERLKAAIATKGIVFFQAVDQAQLAAGVNVDVRPSILLEFGNPALGARFITARAEAGLDWPVRLLVTQDADGQVWAVYTDFTWIAERHRITNRQSEFNTATRVIASIAASIAD